jgi:endonuclease/exonuclease/phosphatase family metal-dependent hydrolase
VMPGKAPRERRGAEPAPARPAAERPVIRVATWNLWWQFGCWAERATAIRAVLRQARPDVCGLQEVWAEGGENQARSLADELGMEWEWAASPDPERWRARKPGCSAEVGNAILSRWPIHDVAHVPLPRGGSDDRSRTALACLIDSPHGRLPVVTTQLTAAPWDSAARCHQVRTLAEAVAARARVDFPPIVLGDLNAEPDSDEVRLLCGHKTAPAVPGLVLIDAWRYASEAAIPWTWDRANPHVLATMEPSSRIDYVLVGIPDRSGRGQIRAARRIGAEPMAGIWPSDHAGVLAELDTGSDPPAKDVL